ncbi:MAG: dihydroorotate dehydrogenase [Actinobacteria bacterium]|nr:dihydroorotate dehydrogenase [Actinomycetota bacterium]
MARWRRSRSYRDTVRRRGAVAVDATARVGPIVLPNPIVAASGTFGHGDEVARIADAAGFGAVTTKSLAPYAWPGNEPPRLHPTAAGMLNSVGLQGPGVEPWVERELPALRARGARVIASIWGRTVDDYAVATKMLDDARDDLLAVEVNVSCPNLEDRARMFAHSCEATAAVTRAVVEHARELPVLVKLSPNVTDVRAIAGAAVDAGATGLTLINTVMGLAVDAQRRRPVLGAGGGGLSGPAIKPIALRVVADVARELPSVPIVGTGGVMTGLDAVEMLLAGASAVGVGTATFRDPRAGLHIRDQLVAWCASQGVTRVADLTGRMTWPT